MPPLNILYIHAHDAGRLIAPYGHKMPTPNLTRLASEGMLFRRAFCCGPTCSPSRAAMLTGQSPHATGMLGLAHRGFALNDYGRHLVNTLKPAGYTTMLSGVQHVVTWDEVDRIGYDEILTRKIGGAEAAEAAEQRIAAGLDEPFFMSVGCSEPHRPFPEPPLAEEVARFARAPAPLPDTPETRRDTGGFAMKVERFDAMVGRVLDALDAAGLAERTLVVCTTDHGPAFPGMKCTMSDWGLGVLLMMRGPGVPVGQSTDALVSHLDVFPTVCDWLGIDRPDWLEGHSLAPILRGEAEDVRDAIFGEVTYHAAYEPQRCVRTDRWTYVRRYGEKATRVLPNCDDGLSKTVLLDAGWADRELPREALYDMLFDPTESHNVIDDPALADTVAALRQRLDTWMTDTNDPLLNGPVPPPAGAKINDPDGLSPKEPPREVP
ncbi:MAG: sulfatase [Planctomycetota bacterium]